MTSIKLLSEKAINKIAAGEVVDRPIAVVKELIENAVDAGATKIEINFDRGGRTLISVTDNGCGIKKEQLYLALERHATSKVEEDQIDKIEFFGFRGEALASIAAVGLINITTKTPDDECAWQIETANNFLNQYQISVAKHPQGTTVVLRDIFCLTPNRIKFLKSEASETAACVDLVRRIALSFPAIEFKLLLDNKTALHSRPTSSETEFFHALLGEHFFVNSTKVLYTKHYLTIRGLIGLPTFNHPTSLRQYYFVNNRVIKDKLLVHAVKSAYTDLVPHGRYAAVLLFLDLPYLNVDVNVHPTKSEVRFSDEKFIRRSVIDAIRTSLSAIHNRQSTTVFDKVVEHMRAKSDTKLHADLAADGYQIFSDQRRKSFIAQVPLQKTFSENTVVTTAQDYQVSEQVLETQSHSLGNAICQIENTYIVATDRSALIIVDQHAAHERMMLEKMKSVARMQLNSLLIPIILSYDSDTVAFLLAKQEEIKKIGIHFERYGISEISIVALPSVMEIDHIALIMEQIISYMKEFDIIEDLEHVLAAIYANMACKNSVKAGRSFSLVEMNALLREMEITPLIEQCNHGRPTYVKVTVQHLQKLFERS